MAFDFDEGNPQGTSYIADYPGNEQAHRNAVLSSVDEEHYAATSGFHRQVSLPESAVKPAFAANHGYVYTKEADGEAELFYEGEDGVEVQLTSGGSASPDKLPLAGGVMTGDVTMTDADLLMEGTSLVKLLNAIYLQGRDFGDANWRDLIGLNVSDEIEIGDASLSADGRIYVTDADGLVVNYGSTDYPVWNKGHFATAPIFTHQYTSDPITFALNDEGTDVHGIGSTPILWAAMLECLDDDLGFVEGDVVPIVSGISDQLTTGVITTALNAAGTAFIYRVGNDQPNLVKTGSNGAAQITVTNWAIVFHAWY